MEDIWLGYAKRLQALAVTGLHYSPEEYDRERFAEIDSIARQMMARLGRVPLAHLTGLPEPCEGYATPKNDIRAAVIREGRILLVREKSDGRWTMPGGFADIGHSASEVAVKETREEAGLRVRADRLFCLRHRAKQPGDPDHRDFYKIFFLCTPLDDAAPAPGPETSGAEFFATEDIPEMSLGRSTPADIARALAHHADPTLPAEFD
ncbi:NUDIX hydrolase [Tropicimonas sp. IMCC6043]|uniref:NUDIX hydrolase n=1 Tax=Tropicimonas sp. IMCC6043 TaxID=2510645 RepID=UPI00101C6888|nr:NUDIX hydrolase N-terminal domain-containing protein [Tropicimonas sp. IMCC6043]RYH08322.1 NUDIX domain-containing protein [Tropicimonas sp. IMCC6043]